MTHSPHSVSGFRARRRRIVRDVCARKTAAELRELLAQSRGKMAGTVPRCAASDATLASWCAIARVELRRRGEA